MVSKALPFRFVLTKGNLAETINKYEAVSTATPAVFECCSVESQRQYSGITLEYDYCSVSRTDY